MDRHRPAAPASTGFWSIEPVHDAIVAERLRDLRAGLHQRADEDNAAAGQIPASGRRRDAVRAVRVRLGHALVAIGSLIEGASGDCGETSGVRAA